MYFPNEKKTPKKQLRLEVKSICIWWGFFFFAQVREKDLPVVVGTLEEFNIYREIGGESLLIRGHDIANGLHNNGKEG